MFLMTYDPSPEVRNAVLSQIALTKTTLPLVLERCRDVSEANRKNAYALVAEKLSLKVLNLTQRTQIIEGGLNDPSGNDSLVLICSLIVFELSMVGKSQIAEAVKSVMEKKVIPTWLKNCNGKITDFLYRLDLTANESVGERVLKALFKHKEPEELVKEFDLLTPRYYFLVTNSQNV